MNSQPHARQLAPLLPNLPSSSFSPTVKKEEVVATPLQNSLSLNERKQPEKKWDEADVWLLDFLTTQTSLDIPPEANLTDYRWWEKVNTAIGGFDRASIEREFAKMGAWVLEPGNRAPRPAGWKRFIRTWLERHIDREERKPHVVQTDQRRWQK